MQAIFVLTMTAVALCLVHVESASMHVKSVSTDARWAEFKRNFGKHYNTAEEEHRRNIWEHTLQKIEDHNKLFEAGKSSFSMGENKYSDMTNEEYRITMLGYVGTAKQRSGETFHSKMTKDLPKSVDWREKGYVTKVKDQGQCGSCWAFSTTGSLEGQHARATGNLVSLSESNLVDCSSKEPYGNHGCGGGWMDNAFQYIIYNQGIDTESSYSYEPKQRKCAFKKESIGATMKSFTDLPEGNETALQEAVATIGPVSVAINAASTAFQSYRSGVFNHPDCDPKELDHGVLVVGYGHDETSGLDYWIVKNSWSPLWGNNGYIWMTRNKNNQCGIATAATYPNV